MGNKTHLAFLSRKTFDTGPRAQSQLLKGKTDLLRIVMKDGESQGPSYLIRLRRVTARWGMRWFPISDPLTERAPTTVHRPDASVRISKLLGRLEKGVLGWGSAWLQERIAYLTWQRSPSASCQPREQGVQQEFIDWSLGFKNTPPLLQRESGMLGCHHQNSQSAVTPLAPGP